MPGHPSFETPTFGRLLRMRSELFVRPIAGTAPSRSATSMMNRKGITVEGFSEQISLFGSKNPAVSGRTAN
jgi:hypothetical protein